MKEVKDMKRPELMVVAKMVGVSIGRKTNEDLIRDITKACNDLNLQVLRSDRGIKVKEESTVGEGKKTHHKYGTRIVDNFHSQVFGVR